MWRNVNAPGPGARPSPDPFLVPDQVLNYAPPPGLPQVVDLDDAWVVVVKPAGLLSVPGRRPEHHDSALLRLQGQLGPLWVVHRLDMDTSGLIAFARTREAAAHLGRQFERRTVNKRYEALVWGRPPAATGTIVLPMRLDWPIRPRQIVDGRAGKPSCTRYRLMAVEGRYSRLELAPITGRSHQLRLHLSAIGLPIVGDRFYGWEGRLSPCRLHDLAPEQDGPRREDRLMLHARRLALVHPNTGQPVQWEIAPAF